MAEQNPQAFMEKLESYSKEEQIRIIGGLLGWADAGKASSEKLQELQERADFHKEKSDFYAAKIRMLEDELKKCKAAGSGAADSALVQETERLRTAYTGLLQKQAELEQTLDSLRKEHAVLRQKCSGLESEAERLNQEHDALVQKNTALDEQVRTLEIEKQQLSEAQASVNPAWEQEKQSLTRQLNELRVRAEQAESVSMNAQINTQGMAARLQELNAVSQSWEAEKQKYEQKIEALRQLNKELTEKSKKNEKIVSQAQGWKIEAYKYKDAQASWKVERTRFAEQIAQLEGELARMRSNVQQGQEQKQRIEDEKRRRREAKSTAMPGEMGHQTMQGVGGFAEIVQPEVWNPVGSEQEHAQLMSEKKALTEKCRLLESEKEVLMKQLADDSASKALEAEIETLKKQLSAAQEKEQAAAVTAEKYERLVVDSRKQTEINAGLCEKNQMLMSEKARLQKEVRTLTEAKVEARKVAKDRQTLSDKNRKLEAELAAYRKAEEEKRLADEAQKQAAAAEQKAEEEKRRAQAYEEAAATLSYEMRVSMLVDEVVRHEASYLVTHKGSNGNIRISDSAPRKKAYFVQIENQAFPNPYFFRALREGGETYNKLIQLSSLFDIDGLDSQEQKYVLASVEPAKLTVPEEPQRGIVLEQKGKLKFNQVEA